MCGRQYGAVHARNQMTIRLSRCSTDRQEAAWDVLAAYLDQVVAEFLPKHFQSYTIEELATEEWRGKIFAAIDEAILEAEKPLGEINDDA